MKFSQLLLISSAWLPSLFFGQYASGELLQQSQIKGLLVYELQDGSLASQASQMNATLIKSSSVKEFQIGFNQKVGEQMTAATAEVQKFISLRHPDRLPEKQKIEFAFENKHNPKDGPSAAVVCALMANSIIIGEPIDPGFAATGDMTATGAVRPVGGVADKIRGAIKKNCTIVGIPESNHLSISDSYIIDGIKPLYDIQIFTLSTFEEAYQIASQNRSEEIQEALDEFASVQTVLKKNERFIFNVKVQEKLRKVYKAMPNHLSAKILLLHSLRRGPNTLSLLGSLNGIDQAGTQLSVIIKNDSYMKTGGNDDVLRHLVNDLQRLRPQLDKRTLAYADSYRELSEFIQDVRNRKTWNRQLEREFNASLAAVNSNRDQLLNEPEIQEELQGN